MNRFLVAAVILLVVYSGIGFAQESPKITYISADHVYLNIGMDQGVHAGDTIYVNQTDFLVIVSVSSTRAAAQSNRPFPETLINSPLPPDYLKRTATRLQPKKEEEKVISGGFSQEKWKKDPVTSVSKVQPVVRGLFQIQQIHQTFTAGKKTYSYNQPGYSLYLTVPRLFADHWGFRLRYRALYTNLPYSRTYDEKKSFFNSLDNRVYEASVVYNEDDGLFFQSGRFSARTLWSAGLIDGALVEAPVSKAWRIGAVAGTSPDYQEMAFRTQNPKYGVYAFHETGTNQTESIGWIGEYVDGTLSREFISHDINWFGESWSWSQSGDLDLNRGWKGKRDNAVVLSNLNGYGRYRFSEALQPYASANIRRPIWTADVRSVADTLFDMKYQQSINLGLRSDFSGGWYTDGSFGYRHRNGDPMGTVYLGFLGGLKNILQSGWSVSSNTSGYINEVYTGWTETISVAGLLPFDLNSYSSVTVQGYTTGGEGSIQTDYLFSESLSRQVFNSLFLTGSAELGKGNTLDLFRFFFSASYRF